MPSLARPALALSASCLLGVACSGGSGSAAGTTAEDGGQGSDTGQAGQASDGGSTRPSDAGSSTSSLNSGYMKANWGSNVTVTYGDCTLTYVSNGLPNHARDTEYALPNTGVTVPTVSTAHAGDDPTAAQSYNFTLNTCPTLASTTTATSLGGIGYMISGAALFNPYEGDASTVALASNFSVLDASGNKAYFVDSGNGHPTPGGQYHYHGLPYRVTAEVDTAGGPSHLIGIALDGFPVYGNYDVNGTEVTEADLDACNGITSPTPEYPGGVYHYVLLDTTDGSSSLRCYHGTPATSASTGGGMMGPPPGDGGLMGPPPGDGGAVGLRGLSGCGSNLALARLDPSPAGRLWTGISRSFRQPFGSL